MFLFYKMKKSEFFRCFQRIQKTNISLKRTAWTTLKQEQETDKIFRNIPEFGNSYHCSKNWGTNVTHVTITLFLQYSAVDSLGRDRLSTSNLLSGRAIWDKLPKSIFENIEVTWVKQKQFQNFQKSRGWFIPKIARTKHVITG